MKTRTMLHTSVVAGLIVLVAGSVSPALAGSAITAADESAIDDYVGEMIVFTAHQDWLSRIYMMRMDGSVIGYYQYDFYYLADVEVIDNEVYIAEAFAPRVLRFDVDTGDLDVIVDDWSLYYFYDVAFDETYIYVTEWDLNRYDVTGDKDGTASFDEDTMGGAWDGSYLWTLNDAGQIKCWNVAAWPNLTELPANGFSPPSSACRGLWFDGQYFWSAEDIDGVLGNIYRFDHTGQVVDQWRAPAFRGWAACVIVRYPQLSGDFDNDCVVDLTDFSIFAAAYGSQRGDPNWNVLCDLDRDGVVDLTDFGLFAAAFGTTCD
jgi:hypothetical protein